jgi:hypothetical protein
MLRGLTGYATLIDPDLGKKEADTFTCGHCQRIVAVKPYGQNLDELGGRCGGCDQLICAACVDTGRCDPFEEKLKRFEAKAEARRSYADSF